MEGLVQLPLCSPNARPYYDDGMVTIYRGDCREILPSLSADAVITDPVWPNASAELAGAERPYELFAEAARLFPVVAQCAVIQLGIDSDPRFLAGMPGCMRFFRVCWLEYRVPSYKGRVLYSGDVAYVFGNPPRTRHGSVLLPGRVVSRGPDMARGNFDRTKRRFRRRDGYKDLAHPSPRNLAHVRWLVKWFGGDCVVDPFMGSGTTAIACMEAGIRFFGIEIEEAACAVAVERLAEARGLREKAGA
jgi:hypothetical protein